MLEYYKENWGPGTHVIDYKKHFTGYGGLTPTSDRMSVHSVENFGFRDQQPGIYILLFYFYLFFF